MKAKNTIFFGEKGISSTSANHLANIAKEIAERNQKDLKSISFVNTSVSLIGTEINKEISKGITKEILDIVPEKLKAISDMYSFCAWMREAIKAKEDELKYLERMDLIEYCIVKNIETPKHPISNQFMTEEQAIGMLSIADRQEYYKLEAEASVIGKYIHPGNEFNTARDKAFEKNSNPNTVLGSGKDMVIYNYELSCSIEDIESSFFNLQSIHRSVEAKLNSIKFKIKSFIDESKSKEEKEYAEKLNKYTDRKNELIAEMNIFISEEKKKLLDMKIIIPHDLKIVHEYLLSIVK